jgi:DNA-binding transcriptional LysR family regulator
VDKLSAMKSFRRIVELGSFRAAAADRGLSNAGVSKQLLELESELGASLLIRTTRKLSLTETGRAYFERCVRILDDIAESEAAVVAAQSAPRGLLRVSAPMSLGLLRLMAWVPEFMQAYPHIQLDLVFNDRAVDVIDEGFDVAIRVRTKLADSTLIVKRLGTLTRIVCASPKYLAAVGALRTPHDLPNHRALVYSLSQAPTEWTLTPLDGGAAIQQRVVPALCINNSIGLRDAVLAAMGVALIPRFVITEELRHGTLVDVLPGWESEDHSLFVIYPSSRHLSPKVRAFVDFITHAAANTVF